MQNFLLDVLPFWINSLNIRNLKVVFYIARRWIFAHNTLLKSMRKCSYSFEIKVVCWNKWQGIRKTELILHRTLCSQTIETIVIFNPSVLLLLSYQDNKKMFIFFKEEGKISSIPLVWKARMPPLLQANSFFAFLLSSIEDNLLLIFRRFVERTPYSSKI